MFIIRRNLYFLRGKCVEGDDHDHLQISLFDNQYFPPSKMKITGSILFHFFQLKLISLVEALFKTLEYLTILETPLTTLGDN